MASFGGSIKLEGASEYKKALNDITQNLKVVSAEMKATASSTDKENASQKELIAKSKEFNSAIDKQKSALASAKSQLDELQKQYSNNKNELDKLNKEYDDEKKKLDEIGRTLGTSSDEYKKQEKVVADLEEEINKSEKALDSQGRAINDMRIKTANAETTINKTAKSVDELGKEEKETTKETEKSGDGFTVLKGILSNLATQVITSVIDGMKKMASSVKETVLEVASLGDEIDKESQKLGMSAQTYQELSYAMERSGADIDSFKKGVLNINTALAGVENGVDGASDKFDALGVSLQNADGSMRSSEDVLLDSIDALARMEDETQRNALANDVFGKSYTELAPLLNSGAEGIKELMQEAEDYGMVMSDETVKASAEFEDSLTRLDGAVTGLKSRLVGELLPSFGEVVDGLSLMASGSEEGGEKLTLGIKHALDDINKIMPNIIKAGGEILKGIMQGITDNLDTILDSALQLVTTLADSLVQNLPVITSAISSALPSVLQAVITLIVELLSHLSEILQPILDALPLIITQILDTLASNIGQIVSGIVQCVVMILDHLPEIISALIEGIPQVIVALIGAIIENLPTLIVSIIQCVGEIAVAIWDALGTIWTDYISPWLGDTLSNVGEWFLGLITSIGEWFAEIFASVGEFFGNVWSSITGWFSSIIDKVVTWCWNVYNKVTTFRDNVVTSVKNLFTNIWSSITSWFSTIINKVINFVKDIPTKIQEGFSAVKDAGLNLVKGLWNGISDAAGWVLDKIKGFGQSILNGIKSIFGIASPSKEMAWMGEMLGEGLAQGIEDSSIKAIHSAEDMVKGINGAVNWDDMNGNISIGTYNSGVGTMIELLETYLPQLADMKIYLDSGEFVGATASKMNDALGRISVKTARGIA